MDETEEKLVRSVALQNAQAVLLARERAERELVAAKEALELKSAELAEQREFFRVTLSSIGDAVITTDTSARVTFLNPVAETMTGWTSTDAIGQPLEKVFDIINEQSREPAPSPVARVLREGVIVGLANHTALIARDGSETAIDDSAAPIRDGTGKISGVVMVFHDVTEQRRAETALRESNERVTNILESITDAFFVLDKEWRFTYVNQQAEQALRPLKKSRANLLGKNYWEQFPDVVGTSFEKNFRQAMSEHAKVEFESCYLPLNAWFEIRAFPAPDSLSIYFLDITVRKRAAEAREQAEERLRRSEEELRSLANSIPQLVWMANPDGQIFWYNRGWYEYTGTSPAQMEESGWQVLHDPKALPVVLERWTESLRAGTDFEMEFPLRGADGAFRWFLTRVKPFRDDEGRITRWFGTNTNIDEQRQLIQSLSEAREHLEKRVQERTVELENANESLRVLSAKLLRIRDEEQRHLARELHDSVGQLLAAIAMNINTVKSEAHKLSPGAARCVSENAGLLEEVIREIRTISHLLHPPLLDELGLDSALRVYTEGFAERSKIKVKLEIPSDLGRLPNDTEIAIFRMVQECLTNIHRHSGSDMAEIRIHREDGHLVVQVEDSGKGMSKEKIRELAHSGGTGVGFSGMRERLRRLGGTLNIQSDGSATVVTGILDVGDESRTDS